MSHFSLCLPFWPNSGPFPSSSQPPKPLITLSFGMRVICCPGSSQHPKLQHVSHISHSAAMDPSGIAFPQSWTLSFITSTQKVPAGCRFYMRGIVLFLLAEQLLLTVFSLQTCLTRLHWQTVEQLNCNQSNFIYMTSLGSPQQIFFPLLVSLASRIRRTPAGLMVQSSILSGYKRTKIKSL